MRFVPKIGYSVWAAILVVLGLALSFFLTSAFGTLDWFSFTFLSVGSLFLLFRGCNDFTKRIEMSSSDFVYLSLFKKVRCALSSILSIELVSYQFVGNHTGFQQSFELYMKTNEGNVVIKDFHAFKDTEKIKSLLISGSPITSIPVIIKKHRVK